ncbi:MAG: hypothetical protein H0V45_06385 [Actinobacteria bacterium]|nr:hypothetical protein [Actinomycetota bacterium]
MKRLRLGAAAVAAFALTALPAQGGAAPIKLTGTVGPGFTIKLTIGGKTVKALKPGKYALTIADRSAIHNFHLTGPGVKVDSGVARKGTKTYPITLRKGTYKFVCDPHNTTMKGSFVVR